MGVHDTLRGPLAGAMFADLSSFRQLTGPGWPLIRILHCASRTYVPDRKSWRRSKKLCDRQVQ